MVIIAVSSFNGITMFDLLLDLILNMVISPLALYSKKTQMKNFPKMRSF